nr:MAG: RNA dependent RNA polymerase [Leviviridae sp.]
MDDGWVRDEPCHLSIRLLRQVTLWGKKIQKGYSDESLRKATEDFIQVDAALPSCPRDLSGAADLLVVARAIVERLFRHVGDPSHSNPRHGPGAVAGGEGTIWKRKLAVSYTDLEAVFRPIPWFVSLRDAAESPERVYGRVKRKFGLSKIRFVEKDSSGPRTIGLEPAEYMWVQQALKGLMYHYIETRSFAKGRINFTDQTINRRLSMQWRRYETLDMSKASDRNSLVLVEALFGRTRLWPWLQASRTPGTVLPDGRILMYKKFAPMGSAVCFPVQAVVYYALACAAQHLAGMPLFLACRNTYVYGDDLIVLRGNFSRIDSAFSSVGLKFNTDKCCTEGRFRESCGMDAFDGYEVTPARMRLSDVRGRTDIAKLVEHSNRLMDAGYWNTAIRQRELTKRVILHLNLKMSFPISHRTDFPFLTWRAAPWETETVRYRTDNKTGLTFVKGWAYRPKVVESCSELEVMHLRESLSRGGPVGELKFLELDPENREDDRYTWAFVGPRLSERLPMSVRRYLAQKYSGDLIKTRFAVVREYC